MNRTQQVTQILANRETIQKSYAVVNAIDPNVTDAELWRAYAQKRNAIERLPIMQTELARQIKIGACYPSSVQEKMQGMSDADYLKTVTLYTRPFKGLTRAQMKQERVRVIPLITRVRDALDYGSALERAAQ